MANQFLSLSLFIMMLSFFIILNAMSSFKAEKAQAVLQSLEKVFTSDREIILTVPGDVPTSDTSIHEGSVLDDLQSYFTAQIVGIQVKQNRLGTEMQVRMPLEKFKVSIDNALNTELRNENNSFLPTLISLLNSQNAVPYRMDIVLRSDTPPLDLISNQPEQYKKLIREISFVSEKLEEAGMAPKFISIGLGQGEEGMIDIYFRRHKAFKMALGQKGASP